MKHQLKAGFTLVEILIVVVILGILASVVVANTKSVTTDASVTATTTELAKIRRAVEVYRVRNSDSLPQVEAGSGSWGPIVSDRDYLKEAPRNPYVGSENAMVITLADAPDSDYQTEHGWIYNNETGQVWAGGFDENDQPIARP
ncbi:MAG: type II secretion system protein [Phycisphaerales bacterium]